MSSSSSSSSSSSGSKSGSSSRSSSSGSMSSSSSSKSSISSSSRSAGQQLQTAGRGPPVVTNEPLQTDQSPPVAKCHLELPQQQASLRISL